MIAVLAASRGEIIKERMTAGDFVCRDAPVTAELDAPPLRWTGTHLGWFLVPPEPPLVCFRLKQGDGRAEQITGPFLEYNFMQEIERRIRLWRSGWER